MAEDSSWMDDELKRGPKLYDERLSLLEHKLILRVRSLGEGEHVIRLRKSGRGRRRLFEFRVRENKVDLNR